MTEHLNYEADFLKISGAMLIIEAGYAWDGPSGPTWDSKSSMRASLIHDALYQLMRIGILPEKCREQADDVLYDICIEDGMFKPRAWIWYKAVRLMASDMAKNGTEREIHIAP
ncbi:MAG: DUF1353 domain-containing protein [Melioribacteraceae bacterium]